MYPSQLVSIIRSLSENLVVSSSSESTQEHICCHHESTANGSITQSSTQVNSSNTIANKCIEEDIVMGDPEEEESSECQSESEFGSSEYSNASTNSSIPSPKISSGQLEMRKKIVEIQADTSISATEKSKQIQELMTKKWSDKQKTEISKDERVINRLENKRADFTVIEPQDKIASYQSPSVFGCRHYQRASKLQAHCCGNWYPCRFCHDEVSDHTITRNLIVTMMCMHCSKVQPAGQECIECKQLVSKYFCKECKLWDNDPRKNIYHCHECGICRIGKGLGIDYFHCKTCNVCMAIGLKGKHKCIERNLESDCPICGEYMFTSTSTVIFMPCGHCMHHKCHQQYIQTSYQCPTCLKSLADVSEYFRRIDVALVQHKMPDEYSSTYSHIYCNDCEKKCHATYHFLYHKCAFCKGYNTKLLNTIYGLPEGAIMAEPLKITEIENVDSAVADIRLSVSSSISHRNLAEMGTSFTSSSSRISTSFTHFCHSCQTPSLVNEQDGNGCVTCGSEFVEELS